MKPGKCKSCGAAIWWVETVNGNMMPLDEKPVDDGNIVVSNGTGYVMHGDLFDEPTVAGPRFKSHFATCPNARTHRKKGAK